MSRHKLESLTVSIFAQLPDEGDLQRAAEDLNTGKKVTVLAGRGALRIRMTVCLV